MELVDVIREIVSEKEMNDCVLAKDVFQTRKDLLAAYNKFMFATSDRLLSLILNKLELESSKDILSKNNIAFEDAVSPEQIEVATAALWESLNWEPKKAILKSIVDYILADEIKV